MNMAKHEKELSASGIVGIIAGGVQVVHLLA